MAPGHMLLVNGVNVAAGNVVVGDELSTDLGTVVTTAVADVLEPGLYHIYVGAEHYFARDPDDSDVSWIASSNLVESFGRTLYDKSKVCYAEDHPMPSHSYDVWDWPELHTTPCSGFPYMANLTHND